MLTAPDEYKIAFGSNLIQRCRSIVAYDGEPVMKVTRRDNDGQIGVDVDLYDETGMRIALVRGHRILAPMGKGGEVLKSIQERFRFEHGPTSQRLIDLKSGRVICDIQRLDVPENLALQMQLYLPKPGILVAANLETVSIGPGGANPADAGTVFIEHSTFRNCWSAINIGKKHPEYEGGVNFNIPATW